MMVGKN
jgi:Ion transport protein